MPKGIYKCALTFFYIGYLPARGTVASIFPALVYYLIRDNPLTYNILAVLFLLFTFLVVANAHTIFKEKDPPKIVLDDMAGMFVSFVFVPFKSACIVVGFIIFRLFDIVKIYPLRKIENLSGVSGIILDDLCAGIYTNIILQILLITKVI